MPELDEETFKLLMDSQTDVNVVQLAQAVQALKQKTHVTENDLVKISRKFIWLDETAIGLLIQRFGVADANGE